MNDMGFLKSVAFISFLIGFLSVNSSLCGPKKGIEIQSFSEFSTLDDFTEVSKVEYSYEKIPIYEKPTKKIKGQNKPFTRINGKFYFNQTGLFYLKDRYLLPSESVSISITPTNSMYIGLVVNGVRLDIGNLKNLMGLFRVGNTEYELKTIYSIYPEDNRKFQRKKSQIDNYIEKIGSEEKKKNIKNQSSDNNTIFPQAVNLIVSRGEGENKNKIFWRVTGAYAKGEGEYVFPQLGENCSIGLSCSGKISKETNRSYGFIENFIHGKIKKTLEKLPPLDLAIWVPKHNEKARSTFEAYFSRNYEAIKTLHTISGEGPVTKEDITMMKNYYSKLGMPHSNLQKSLHWKFEKWIGCSNMYRISKDLWFLYNSIKIAEQVILVGSNSEKTFTMTDPVSGVKNAHSLLPKYINLKHSYPSILGCVYSDNKDLYLKYDTGSFGSSSSIIADVALLIAENKGLWNLKVPDSDPNKFGNTYKDRALTYLDYVHRINKNVFELRLDESDFTYKYPTLHETGRRLKAYNRWFMALLALPASAEALELFGEQHDRIVFYDKVVQSGLDHIMGIARQRVVDLENGQKAWLWPYRGEGEKALTKAEDINHGGYTTRALNHLYSNRKYKMTEEEYARFGRALVYLAYNPKDNKWTSVIDGSMGSKGNERIEYPTKLLAILPYAKAIPDIDNFALEQLASLETTDVINYIKVLIRRYEKWGYQP